MVAKKLLFWVLLLALLLSACVVFRGETVHKIALLASFEGRYREIGYDALYAARLALNESGIQNIELLAIDDGGSIETALARANAIRQDTAIKAVIALGIYATDGRVQVALGHAIPMIIVGHWNAEARQANVFMLSSGQFSSLLNWEGDVTAIPNADEVISSEILALYQVPSLVDEPSRLTIYSSATLPDDNFRQRYLNSGLYVPEPNILATLSYDATGLVLEAIIMDSPLAEMNYSGINGLISFENGYWRDAPIYTYGYDETGQLILKP